MIFPLPISSLPRRFSAAARASLALVSTDIREVFIEAVALGVTGFPKGMMGFFGVSFDSEKVTFILMMLFINTTGEL
jgi:hypothetical protein